MEVGFFVMADFMNYKSGIYKYQQARRPHPARLPYPDGFVCRHPHTRPVR